MGKWQFPKTFSLKCLINYFENFNRHPPPPSNYLLFAESVLFVSFLEEAPVIVVKDIQIFSLTNPEKIYISW